MTDKEYVTYSTRGPVRVPAGKVWAPCLHDPKDKPAVKALLEKVLGKGFTKSVNPLFNTRHLPERQSTARRKNDEGVWVEEPYTIKAMTIVNLNPKLTEWLLWKLSELPLRIELYSDQWVGVRATGPKAKDDSEEVSTWVEADDFTLAIAKTIELWSAAFPEEDE